MTRALVLLAALAAAACGARTPDVVPAAVAAIPSTGPVASWVVASVPASVDASARIVPGAEIVRIDASGRSPLSKGFAAAGAPSVRHDGERVLFVAREREGGPFSIQECAPDGTARRVLVAEAEDCTGAAWLPDGRIVWSARAQDAAHALFVGKGDGTPGERITWGNDDTDPTVLSDGRVLFVSRRAGESGARSVLSTVHPDGSGLAPFHAGPLPLERPRQLASLDVECAEIAPDGSRRRVVLDWDAPSRRVADPPAEASPAPGVGPGERWDVVLPLGPRMRPQGHLSSVKPGLKFGTLVAVDARSGGRGASVRFRAGNAVLGPVPLERDGSFSVRLPADRPFRTEVLDAAGAVVAAETGAMWIRPGETRLCVGCHDDVETGPPNVRPLALAKDAVDLVAGEDRR